MKFIDMCDDIRVMSDKADHMNIIIRRDGSDEVVRKITIEIYHDQPAIVIHCE